MSSRKSGVRTSEKSREKPSESHLAKDQTIGGQASAKTSTTGTHTTGTQFQEMQTAGSHVAGREHHAGGKKHHAGGKEHHVAGREQNVSGKEHHVAGREQNVGGRDQSLGERMSQKKDEAKEQMKDKTQEASDLMSQKKEQLKDKTQEASDRMSQKMDEAEFKAQATYDHLKDFPSEINCSSCHKTIKVPASTFQWNCHQCSKVNEYESNNCVKCNAPCPREEKKYTVTCSSCHKENDVPTTNAMKNIKETGQEAKSKLAAAKDSTISKLQQLGDTPETFNCEHCNALLKNPNYMPEQKQELSQESQKSQQQKQQQQQQQPLPHETQQQAQSGSHQPKTQLDKISCPACHKITKIPGSNITAALSASTTNLARSIQRAYYGIAGKKYANCPMCQNPVEVSLPKDKAPTNVDLTCDKCHNQFPASINVE